jgi:hypothetical protein
MADATGGNQGFAFDQITASFSSSAIQSFLVTVVVVCLASLSLKRLRTQIVPNLGFGSLIVSLILAAKAYAVAAGAVLAIGLVVLLAQVDGLDGRGLMTGVLVLLVYGGVLAILALTWAMGVPLNFSENSSDSFADQTSVHLRDDVSGWYPLLLFVAPIVVARASWGWFTRSRPASQRDLSRAALLIGACFGAAVFIGTLIAGVSFNGFGESPFGGDSGFVELRFSADIGLALIFGLFWGMVGAFGAAVMWGRAHGVPLIVTAPPAGVASATESFLQGPGVNRTVSGGPDAPIAPPASQPPSPSGDSPPGVRLRSAPPPDPTLRSD